MEYQVPQFIEIEDKIFGPFTLKQFIYLAGSAGLCVVIWKLLPFLVAVIVIIPVAGFGLALAFYKVNNKPFINVVEAAVKYFLTNKLYIWKKTEKTPEARQVEANKLKADEEIAASLEVPRLSESKLHDLTWNLDVTRGKERL